MWRVSVESGVRRHCQSAWRRELGRSRFRAGSVPRGDSPGHEQAHEQANGHRSGLIGSNDLTGTARHTGAAVSVRIVSGTSGTTDATLGSHPAGISWQGCPVRCILIELSGNLDTPSRPANSSLRNRSRSSVSGPVHERLHPPAPSADLSVSGPFRPGAPDRHNSPIGPKRRPEPPPLLRLQPCPTSDPV